MVVPILLRLRDLAQCLFKEVKEAKEYLDRRRCQAVLEELGLAGRFAVDLLPALSCQGFLPRTLAPRVWQRLKPNEQALALPEKATALITLDTWEEAWGQAGLLSPLLASISRKARRGHLSPRGGVGAPHYAQRRHTHCAAQHVREARLAFQKWRRKAARARVRATAATRLHSQAANRTWRAEDFSLPLVPAWPGVAPPAANGSLRCLPAKRSSVASITNCQQSHVCGQPYPIISVS